MSIKSYYQILGVAQDAEDFVIRAAYKALAQRYHPDKYQGSSEVASKMLEINEAYEILSDVSKRRVYDKALKANQNSNQDDSQQNSNNENPDWSFALEYHPHLKELESGLRRFSSELAESFKAEILKSKQFNRADGAAKKLEREFFEERFGTSPQVIDYAKELLLEGLHEAAKELNQALIMFGDDFNLQDVILKINLKYNLNKKPKSSPDQSMSQSQDKQNDIDLSFSERIKTIKTEEQVVPFFYKAIMLIFRAIILIFLALFFLVSLIPWGS